MLSLLLLALAPQEVDIIRKTQKLEYIKPVEECEKAAGLIDSDPKQALEILDSVINNTKIDRKDRRLKIETSGGEYTRGEPYSFYPHQYRGRARMALAKLDPKKAKEHLTTAVEDLKRSVEYGLKSSEAYLKAAQESLAKIDDVKTPETDPEPAFRKDWEDLLKADKFASAQRFIESNGAFLAEPKRKSYVAETVSACDTYVTARLSRFRDKMSAAHTVQSLKALKRFDEDFALPDDTELARVYPELVWARKEREALLLLRNWDPKPRLLHEETKSVLGLLLEQMVASQELPDAWFDLASETTYFFARDRLETAVNKAKSEESTPDERRRLKKWMDAIQGQLEKACDRLPKAFVESHPDLESSKSRLRKVTDQFPVDPGELDSIDLDACYSEADPIKALQGLETKLRGIRTQHRDRLPRDSSQKLMTYLIAATAMRQMLEGRDSERISADLREWCEELRGVGGPIDARRWGPKVEKFLLNGK